ncbi:hypothetical protein AVEN_74061-1 [Araneus ventricosus]|uniref:Uncharacterized protein n=1 Tax=Araneus ventricosus TaxID=182803 RepID=A0A4Y2KS62_ARAVE|nr:hypothetical protein AVEN_74061-1 [Araneus ventricosus]
MGAKKPGLGQMAILQVNGRLNGDGCARSTVSVARTALMKDDKLASAKHKSRRKSKLTDRNIQQLKRMMAQNCSIHMLKKYNKYNKVFLNIGRIHNSNAYDCNYVI